MPNTNLFDQNTGSVNYNQVVTPVTPGSTSQSAGIIGYGPGGNAIYQPTPSVITSNQAIQASNNANTALTNVLNNAQNQTPRPTQTPNTTINLGTSNQSVSPFDSQIEQINQSAARELETYNNIFNLTRQRLDAETNSTIANIQQIYSKRKDEMASANKNALEFKRVSGIVSGRDRYAQDYQTDVLSDEERNGIKRIADLDAEQETLIMQAKQAREAKDMEALFQNMQMYETINKSKQAAIANLYKQAIDFEKLAIDRSKEQRSALMDQLDTQAKYADNLAATVMGSLTGDTKQDKEVFSAFASQYGIDPSFIEQAVSEYKLKQNQALPSDLREYEIMKQRGEYNGSFFNYLQSKKNAERVVGSGGGGGISNKSLTQDEIDRFNLPQSLLGKSDQSIIQDLTVSRVPAWFKQFVQQTEPGKTFDQQGWQSIWNTFRNTEDMAVYKAQFKIDLPKSSSSSTTLGPTGLKAKIQAGQTTNQ